MNYEFNNWRAFREAYIFVSERHPDNYPIIQIEVPTRLHGEGWEFLRKAYNALIKSAPEDLENMSIYGWIRFQVTKDENLNNEYA
jgi:hypothetical protein